MLTFSSSDQQNWEDWGVGEGARLKSEFQALNSPFSLHEAGLSWETFQFSPNIVSCQIGQEEEDQSDIFSIKEVSFQSTGDSDWKDTNYTLSTDSLDWVSARQGGAALGPCRGGSSPRPHEEAPS